MARRGIINGFGFDSPNAQLTYRGAALKNIPRKSWDAKGPYVANAVAVAKLCDTVHELHTDDGDKMSVVMNINSLQHYLVAFRADNCLIEKSPWAYEPPYPMQHRYIMGEKGRHLVGRATASREFFDPAQMPYDYVVDAFRGLGRLHGPAQRVFRRDLSALFLRRRGNISFVFCR